MTWFWIAILFIVLGGGFIAILLENILLIIGAILLWKFAQKQGWIN